MTSRGVVYVLLWLISITPNTAGNDPDKQQPRYDVPTTRDSIGKDLKDLQGDNSQSEQNILTSGVYRRIKSAFADEKNFLRKSIIGMNLATQLLEEKMNASENHLVSIKEDLKNDLESLEERMKKGIKENQQQLEKVPDIFRFLQDAMDTLGTKIQENTKSINTIYAKVDNNYYDLSKQLKRNLDNCRKEMDEKIQPQEGCLSGSWVGPYGYPVLPSYPNVTTIEFIRPFKNIPAVVYGLMNVDALYSTNLRVISEITEVTRRNFKLKVDTWSNTVLYGARFSWMACPK